MTEITTEVVRRWYATWPTTTCATRVIPEHLAEFDRWLAEVTKEAYLDGLRDGIMAARRIADYNHVIPAPPADPTISSAGPTLAQDGPGVHLDRMRATRPPARRRTHPADHPQPMAVYTPPTVGFYRVPEETD